MPLRDSNYSYSTAVLHKVSRDARFYTDDELVRIFERLDISKQGRLDLRDLEDALRAASIPLSHANAEMLMRAADLSNDNKIDFGEFVTFVRQRETEVLQVFEALDSNGDGHVNASDLRAALSRLHIPYSDRDIAALISHLDKDRDGVITFREFVNFCLLLPRVSPHAIFSQWANAAGTMVDFSTDMNSAVASDDKPQKPWNLLFSGAVAGMLSRTATAPLDRLKMLLQANAISIEQPSVSSLSSQAQRVLATSGAAAASSASASSLPVRSRQSVVIEGLRQIYREAGVRGYFRGNGTNAVKGSSELSIRFFTYERLKSWFSDRADGVLSTKERFMAGAGAGLISQIAIYPLEVLKTRLGVESQHKSVIGCIRHVVQQGGIAGLYRGLPASCVGIVPYCGIDLTAYALLKDAYAKRFSTDAPVAAMLGFGIVSSSCAQAVVYPLAVAKTRLQLQTHKIGMVRCVTQIVRQEGVRGLYKGLFVNILKVAPAAGISYVVYDTLRVLLDA